MSSSGQPIAILLPCFNEELTVGQTIGDYRAAFPRAEIVVCDNASSDRTAEEARKNGARVVIEPRKGKGFAVRRLFSEVEADHFILADGDNTYPAAEAAKLLDAVVGAGADVGIGDRISKGNYSSSHSRRFHLTGNHLIAYVITRIFGQKASDPLSGLRVFSRGFVKGVPLISQGFEIETELTLQAFDKGFLTLERPIRYEARPAGNPSKLRTFSDGARIIMAFLRFALYFRPLIVTFAISILALLLSIVLGVSPVVEYLTMQYVYKVPSLIVSVGSLLISIVSFFVGFVLESLRYARMENFYLSARLAALSER